ncbi:Chaperone protein HscA [Marinobacterium lacunae]|uniref:Chaperone protein HscA homolog n=1 Tax=Marinobacterium lacunae TaxID=1232683 RepID=A0A081G260_9GAMM|nr:Fe-S protein assembly chaperone HscA [Marinobacterium lacunae]KEA64865.1 Chaperone protein HscA [Marinobacterium lacunae]
MALLQIAEPGQSAAPHERKLAVGIDLGTTNSLAATVRSGEAQTLADMEGYHLLPSVVHYAEDGSIDVGRSALSHAAEDPYNTIASVKRLMGRGVEDVLSFGGEMPYRFAPGEGGMPFIETQAGLRSPVQVSADILRVLRERAEQALEGDLTGVVITVPAYFDDAQRQATKDAARLAGLHVLRLLNEPTAAAVAYGLDQGEEGVIAVYDLGGGTFDISVLRLSRGVFEVLATGGDSALGGDDFDYALARWMLAESGIELELDAHQARYITALARQVKETLSSQSHAEVSVSLGGKEARVSVSRDQFNAVIEPLVKKTLRACRRTLKDAGVSVDEVRDVVMVGGSTRVPVVREKVGDLFGREPHIDIDPDRVVAIGAALQADVLAGNKPDSEMLLLDVIPLSLGLETMGGLVEKVIHRNTAIPVARGQEFTTYQDGQTAMAIHVVQGERELVSDCRSLARFVLRGIPPMAAGAAKIRVTFQIDADGLLSVAAQELSTGVESSIQVKPSYGLSDDEIAGMLKDSFSHAEDDMAARALREQQVEAERLASALEAAIAQDGELLDVDERDELVDAVAELRRVASGSEAAAIEAGVQALAKLSDEFAARRMDKGIQRALKGHRIDELDKESK